MFERIAPELDGGLPVGPGWHRALLETMSLAIPDVRPAVILPETANVLEEYLRFGHAFRNVYGYDLEWPRVEPLLRRLPDAWRHVRGDLDGFLEYLDEASRA